MGTNFAKRIITKMVDKDTYCQPRQEPTDKQKTLLMEEVGNRCPLCGRSIVSYKPNATTRRFHKYKVRDHRKGSPKSVKMARVWREMAKMNDFIVLSLAM